MTEQIDLAAIRRNAAAGLPVLPSTVLTLLDHIAGMEDALSLHLRQIAEQQAYINGLHSRLLAWADAIERCDGIVAAEQAVMRYVAGVRS